MSVERADVQIVITAPQAQYAEFAKDLETLRNAGAESHTAAVISAVAEKAAALRESGQ